MKLCSSSPILGAMGGAELPKFWPKLLYDGLLEPRLGGAGAAAGGAATPGMLFLGCSSLMIFILPTISSTCDGERLA